MGAPARPERQGQQGPQVRPGRREFRDRLAQLARLEPQALQALAQGQPGRQVPRERLARLVLPVMQILPVVAVRSK